MPPSLQLSEGLFFIGRILARVNTRLSRHSTTWYRSWYQMPRNDLILTFKSVAVDDIIAGFLECQYKWQIQKFCWCDLLAPTSCPGCSWPAYYNRFYPHMRLLDQQTLLVIHSVNKFGDMITCETCTCTYMTFISTLTASHHVTSVCLMWKILFTLFTSNVFHLVFFVCSATATWCFEEVQRRWDWRTHSNRSCSTWSWYWRSQDGRCL